MFVKLKLSSKVLPLAIILPIFFAFGLILRFWLIKEIPIAFYHDEMDYVITGEAIARFGTDISGEWQPKLLKPLITYNVTSELAAIFHAIVQKMFGLGVQSGHLPSAIFGVLTTLTSGWLIFLLFKSKKVSLIFMIFLWINPWHVHISRLGYETSISLFFQVLALSAIISFGQNQARFNLKSLVYFSTGIVGILGSFFTYHGAKVTIAGIVLTGLAIALKNTKNVKFILLPSVVFLTILCLAYVQLFYGINQGWYLGRESEFIFSSSFFEKTVNHARFLSFDFPAKNLVLNKLTIIFFEGLKRWASVFDINKFAIGGMENGFQFSLFVHGFWYLSSIILFFFGLTKMLKNKIDGTYSWLILLCISPIASVLNITYQSIFRSALTYILLIAPIVYGFLFVLKMLENKKLFLSIFFLILIIEPIYFAAQLFGRYGIVTAENHFFDDRLLAGYIRLVTQQSNKPIIIILDNDVFRRARNVIAYNDLLKNLTQTEREQFANTNLQTYKFANLTFSLNCPDKQIIDANVIIMKPNMLDNCKILPPKTTETVFPTIASPIDSGAYFYLYQDPVCKNFELPQYVYTNNLNDFYIEKLDNKKFCQTWVKWEKKSF